MPPGFEVEGKGRRGYAGEATPEVVALCLVRQDVQHKSEPSDDTDAGQEGGEHSLRDRCDADRKGKARGQSERAGSPFHTGDPGWSVIRHSYVIPTVGRYETVMAGLIPFHVVAEPKPRCPRRERSGHDHRSADPLAGGERARCRGNVDAPRLSRCGPVVGRTSTRLRRPTPVHTGSLPTGCRPDITTSVAEVLAAPSGTVDAWENDLSPVPHR